MKNHNMVKYETNRNAIVFWCTPADENEKAALAFNDFILGLSENKKVFFHAYRLPEENVSKMIDPAVILEKAATLSDPFNTFFHLRDARVNIKEFEWASSSEIYFFEPIVEWTDFLATSVITGSEKLMEKGLLSAQFSVLDQGADYWFKSNKCYESKVLELFENLSNLGYEIKHSLMEETRRRKKIKAST